MKLATTTGDLWGYTGSQEASMQYIKEAGFRYMDYNFGCDYGNRSGVYADDYLSHFERINRCADRLGVKLVQAHSPMGKPLAEDNAAFIAGDPKTMFTIPDGTSAEGDKKNCRLRQNISDFSMRFGLIFCRQCGIIVM
jgi:hypothetical protein